MTLRQPHCCERCQFQRSIPADEEVQMQCILHRVGEGFIYF